MNRRQIQDRIAAVGVKMVRLECAGKKATLADWKNFQRQIDDLEATIDAYNMILKCQREVAT